MRQCAHKHTGGLGRVVKTHIRQNTKLHTASTTVTPGEKQNNQQSSWLASVLGAVVVSMIGLREQSLFFGCRGTVGVPNDTMCEV
jgi:hypothetical protein